MRRIIERSKQLLTWRAVWMFLAVLAGWVSGFPVAVGMAGEVSTTTLSNDEATEYISESTLRVALYHMALYQFAEKHTIPKGQGRTFQIPRYELLSLPQQPLTQGGTPANTSMTVNKVTCTAEQWGAVITIYDVPMLTVAHPVFQKAINLLGVQAGQVYEREAQRVLMAGTNAQFIAGRANRGALTAADVLVSSEIRKAVANLKHNGATKFQRTATNTTKNYLERVLPEGGGITKAKPSQESQYQGFIGVVDESVSQDLQSDSLFINADAYSNVRALFVGEIGMWLGVNWVESNFMPSIILLTSPTCAGANMSGFAGGFAASTAYDLVVTKVREAYGIEEYVSAVIDVTTGASDDSISVILPSASGYQFRIYAGTNGGTLYEVQSASSATTVAADDITGPSFDDGQTVYVTAIPTSGRVAPVAPTTGITVHVSFILGMEAFGVAELQALQAYITEDRAEKSDPLNQYRTAGWKGMFKVTIQNNSFLRVIESASNFDV